MWIRPGAELFRLWSHREIWSRRYRLLSDLVLRKEAAFSNNSSGVHQPEEFSINHSIDRSIGSQVMGLKAPISLSHPILFDVSAVSRSRMSVSWGGEVDLHLKPRPFTTIITVNHEEDEERQTDDLPADWGQDQHWQTGGERDRKTDRWRERQILQEERQTVMRTDRSSN